MCGFWYIPLLLAQDNNILFESTNPAYQQADTLGLSQFAPVNSGNIHSVMYVAVMKTVPLVC